jgi:hypothetical protein
MSLGYHALRLKTEVARGAAFDKPRPSDIPVRRLVNENHRGGDPVASGATAVSSRSGHP